MTIPSEIKDAIRARLRAGEIPYAISLTVPVSASTIYLLRDELGIPANRKGRRLLRSADEKRRIRNERQNAWRQSIKRSIEVDQLHLFHGDGLCHICGHPKAEPHGANIDCSYPHGMFPKSPVDVKNPKGFWVWNRP